MSDVLVINRDGAPLSMLPVSTITWQTSVRLLVLQKLHVIHTYKNWEVHSPSVTMKVPSVVMTNEYIKWYRLVKYNRYNIYLRDNFTCQICISKPGIHELTIDHVLPRSKGGQTSWDNVITCCRDCNFSKGNNEKITPIHKPKKPSYYDLVARRQEYTLRIKDESWLDYLNWPKDKVQLIKPNTEMEIDDRDETQEDRINRKLTRI